MLGCRKPMQQAGGGAPPRKKEPPKSPRTYEEVREAALRGGTVGEAKPPRKKK